MADDTRVPSGADATSAPASGGSLRAELLARMGHELRTPLNAIIGFIKLVEEGLYTTEEERRDYLANARQSALTLLDLINNILDLARIEAGRMTLESIELNVADLVEEVAKTLAPEAHAKGVEIDALVDPAIPAHLKSDPMRLRQVLYNLAGNAVKFTDAGMVLLRADLEESEGEVSRVRFTVRDTGIGVPEELKPVIFESFVQTPLRHSERLGGVGLGLSIAKQIVEQMGGAIALESRVSAGSTFWFTLNLPRGRTYGARPRSRPAALEDAPVLLVNPDETVRELYLAKLTAIGARPVAVPSAEAALERLAGTQTGSAPLRAVLMDHHVPRDEMLVFARRVRRESGWYQPDLVHLSIIGAAGDAAALREAGITGFITKPATPAALRGALAALLERHGEQGVRLQAPIRPGEAVLPSGRDRFAHVLVAEDNLVNQKLIHALLSKHGYATRMVGNGREAMEALRRERFDLVLMDVQMPVLDGLAATRAIRQRPESRHLPIIAMTADALDGDRERCLAAGMDDYLPKPIMPDVLDRKLNQWLQRPAGAGSDTATQAAGASPGDAVLDLPHLEAVQAFASDHDPARFAAWVEVFRSEARTALDALARCTTHDDRAALRSAAERLALASAGFGAPELLELARGLSAQAAAASPATLEEQLSRLRTAFRSLDAALAARFGAGAPEPPAA